MKSLFSLIAVSGAALAGCGNPSTAPPAPPPDAAVSQPAATPQAETAAATPNPAPPPAATVRRPRPAPEPPAADATPETPPDEHGGHVLPTP